MGSGLWGDGGDGEGSAGAQNRDGDAGATGVQEDESLAQAGGRVNGWVSVCNEWEMQTQEAWVD